MSGVDDPNEETHGVAPRLNYPPRAARGVVRIHWTDATGPHTFALAGRTSAGSAEGAGIFIAVRTVSRLHAELELRADGVWVRDLGSRNGTFVEGIRVDSARVPDGGRIVLGTTELRFESHTTQTMVELWPSDRFGPLVGGSTVMRELFALIARVAPSESTVFVHGETGTGKELVARAIHEASRRADEPFVVIDCAALSESLLESELFGHARGAFTGALAARAGAFESANGGTVFLDEVGELPLSMQPKLLRVLESRTVRRLGEAAPRPVDVRILSATHRDLGRMVNAGAFREDLFFRLAVLPLTIPSLRERPDDIPMLVTHFTKEPLEPDLARELVARPWLGNVRELRNFVERARMLGIARAIALTEGQAAHQTQAHASIPPPAGGRVQAVEPMADRPYKEARDAWIDGFEREYVRELLDRHARNVASAAQAAGLNRTYLYKLIQKHNL